MNKISMLRRSYIHLLVFFPVAICAMAFSGVAFGEVTYTVFFSSSNLSFEKKLEYDLIRLSDCDFLEDVGKPMLPVRYINLIVPAQMYVDSIDVVLAKSEEVGGTFRICPAQPPIPIRNFRNVPDFVSPDSAVYNSQSPFPSRLAEVAHDGSFDGSHVVCVAVYPIQYTPAKGCITFHKEMELRLLLKNSKTSPLRAVRRREHEQKIYRDALTSLVSNTSDIPAYSCEPLRVSDEEIQYSPETLSIPLGSPHVIITSSSLSAIFASLRDWMWQKGIPSQIVTVPDIVASYSGYDTQEKIRNYIIATYQQGTSWILLGGDETIVPIRYAVGYGTSLGDDWSYVQDFDYPNICIVPADLYYSDLSGNWDSDGDHHYGEPDDDDPDYYPEVYIGRLICSTSAEVDRYTVKLKKYEQNPGNGSTSYLTRALFTEADQMQDRQDAEATATHLPSCFSVTIMKESPCAGQCIPDDNSPNGGDVVSAMNTTLYGMVSHLNHGDPGSVSVSTGYDDKHDYCGPPGGDSSQGMNTNTSPLIQAMTC